MFSINSYIKYLEKERIQISSLVKIIYFDEESALDFLDLQEGGRYYFSEEKVKDYRSSVGVEANAEIKAGSKIPFLNLLLSGKTNAAISHEGNKLIQSTLSNTVLTDFIDIIADIEKSEKKKKKSKNTNMVAVFKKAKVKIIKESYAYFKVFTPFTKILEEKIIETPDINIDVTEMEEMLENAKGYYELLATYNGKDVVLRFNSKSYRNNYRIFDLEKMDLTYYGIKVGKCLREDLLLENQIPKDSVENNNDNKSQQVNSIAAAYDQYGEEDEENLAQKNQSLPTDINQVEYLSIYDVILAGIDHD